MRRNTLLRLSRILCAYGLATIASASVIIAGGLLLSEPGPSLHIAGRQVDFLLNAGVTPSDQAAL